jgi:hypothetical protein
MAVRSTKIVIAVIAAAAVVIGGVYGWRALWRTAKDHFSSDTCTIGAYDLDPDQAAVASTMVGAVTKYRITLPERASVLALAAALQESKLTNLAPGAGDRDSVGVLQQRPSQDWGKVAGQPDTLADRARRLNDVGEATKEFLDKLVQVPNWQKLPLAEAVQAVQISADGSAYAQHEQEAQALADALRGVQPAAISCSFDKPTKVASSTTVATQVAAQLGLDTPTAVGRTVRVPGARWQTAAWFVANADRLGIEEVAYDGKAWTRADGWKSAPASAAVVVATMATVSS